MCISGMDRIPPHSPQAHGGMPSAGDPEPEGGVPEPLDPEPEGGVPEPLDPEPEGGVPEPLDPEPEGGVPEPLDPRRRRQERILQTECGGRYRRPPAHMGGPDGPEDYSGFIIVRLSRELPLTEAEDLQELAERFKLVGLASILKKYGLTASWRLVPRGDPKDRVRLEPEHILRLEQEAAQTDLPPLHSLTAYWRIDVRAQPSLALRIVARLNQLVEIDLAYREFAVSDPVVNPSDDPYAGSQNYLDAAPTGIDARWAWKQAHGEGAGIAVIDLEQGWFPKHEDVVSKNPTILYGDNRDGVGTYKGNHGTAVLGEMIATDNKLGVVGIAPAVNSVHMVSHYNHSTTTNGHIAAAILAAIPHMQPGDLLLLEVQRSLKPTEIDDADFDAIRLAVAHGIIVVEAAGNGNTNLDNYTDAAGKKILNRKNIAFRESGAIMVGAALSALPHNRASFSNYGSRIDCYGWGENVASCGYGDLDGGGGNDNKTYTDTFGGTSSASPIVTGAALVTQGMYEANTGTRLSPCQMRVLLSNPATGTAQGVGVTGHIGVMPNLKAIIRKTLGIVPDIYLRDNVGDIGAIPSTGMISASPDIIVRPKKVANPDASFGQGSGTENSTTLGYEIEYGQENFIYVRMKNRGSGNVNGATATVYWSEVSTLVTPDKWNLIGTTQPVNVPQGNTLVVAKPLTWKKTGIPKKGHYCFVGILDHQSDPAPPLPPGPPNFDWNAFRAFIYNHNNVTWRNFNVINDIPDPVSEPAQLPFVIAGAPDRCRVFDLEILQDLPEGAEVWLEVPLGLGRKMMRGRLWEVELHRKRGVARLRLPRKPRLRLCWVRLGKGARYESRFLVRGAKGMERGGHSIAIRQLFGGEEIGRVTWQFHVRRDEEAWQMNR